MSIYLYLKQHIITGKLYFGKTIRNPETYLGSGLHWSRHIKQHGKEHVVNLWYHLFDDHNECTTFALEFSNKMNIVESDQWLNLKPENGLDGGFNNKNKPGTMLNKHHSIKTKELLKSLNAGENNSRYGTSHTEESKLKMRIPKTEAHILKLKAKTTCPHCGKVGGISAMKRHHFDKCKSK